jgi:hypothetical protein
MLLTANLAVISCGPDQMEVGCSDSLLPTAYCALPTSKNGGADRDRTDDPLLAKQVLSQLSYSPIARWPLIRFDFSEEIEN